MFARKYREPNVAPPTPERAPLLAAEQHEDRRHHRPRDARDPRELEQHRRSAAVVVRAAGDGDRVEVAADEQMRLLGVVAPAAKRSRSASRPRGPRPPGSRRPERDGLSRHRVAERLELLGPVVRRFPEPGRAGLADPDRLDEIAQVIEGAVGVEGGRLRGRGRNRRGRWTLRDARGRLRRRGGRARARRQRSALRRRGKRGVGVASASAFDGIGSRVEAAVRSGPRVRNARRGYSERHREETDRWSGAGAGRARWLPPRTAAGRPAGRAIDRIAVLERRVRALESNAAAISAERDRLKADRDRLEMRLAALDSPPGACPQATISTLEANLLVRYIVEYPVRVERARGAAPATRGRVAASRAHGRSPLLQRLPDLEDRRARVRSPRSRSTAGTTT